MILRELLEFILYPLKIIFKQKNDKDILNITDDEHTKYFMDEGSLPYSFFSTKEPRSCKFCAKEPENIFVCGCCEAAPPDKKNK